jgi:hypothetical protein
MIKYEDITAGYEFPTASYELNSAIVATYLEAVDNQDNSGSSPEFIPPLAIAAYAMKASSSSLSLPPGSVHAAQELVFLKPVPIGSIITCHARVAKKVDRGKMHLLVLELNVFDQDGEKVQEGNATVILPG